MTERAPLAQEEAWFARHQDEVLQQFAGAFVLIKGERADGPFPTAEAAYEQGLRQFGLEPFLVKHAQAEEPVSYMPLVFASAQPFIADL